MLESNKKKISIIIVVSSLDIGFNVFFIEVEALLIFSCFCFVINRVAFNPNNVTLNVARKRRC